MLSGSLFRLFVSSQAVLVCYLALFEERSMYALLARSTDGFVLTGLMGLCGLVGIAEIAINDLFSLSFRWDSGRRYRHFGFAAIAFCYAAQTFVAAYHLGSLGLAIFFLWNALWVVAFSLFDANQRSKEAACLHTAN
jgi:hypothetical protein